MVTELQARLREVEERIAGYERQITQLARQNEAAKRLMQLEGVGPITATALVATVGDAKAFHRGRQFAAWLGLVPKQFSTGGKSVLGRITKRGNVYLRTLLIHGARVVLRYTTKRTDAKSQWVEALRQRHGGQHCDRGLSCQARPDCVGAARGRAHLGRELKSKEEEEEAGILTTIVTTHHWLQGRRRDEQ